MFRTRMGADGEVFTSLTAETYVQKQFGQTPVDGGCVSKTLMREDHLNLAQGAQALMSQEILA